MKNKRVLSFILAALIFAITPVNGLAVEVNKDTNAYEDLARTEFIKKSSRYYYSTLTF